MPVRASTLYLGLVAALCCAVAGAATLAGHEIRASRPLFAEKSALVSRLQLTDLCLFTEARYTRNPSMTDFATAFQDSPLALEHFPSGALMQPPPRLAGGRHD